MFCMLKKKKFVLPMFQNITQIVKLSYFFMISNGKGWNYLAVKNLSAFLRGITSKQHGNFYCLNFLYSCTTKYKPQSHKKVFENKDLYNIIMPSEDINILEFN